MLDFHRTLRSPNDASCSRGNSVSGRSSFLVRCTTPDMSPVHWVTGLPVFFVLFFPRIMTLCTGVVVSRSTLLELPRATSDRHSFRRAGSLHATGTYRSQHVSQANPTRPPQTHLVQNTRLRGPGSLSADDLSPVISKSIWIC